MNILSILDYIDNGHMALPEFQRGYVWNRDQVRGLMDSLYRRHPVGGLLVWATESEGASYRGDGSVAPGVVKLLLDGQQRITTLYGVIRGKPPEFFDGNDQAFSGLHFHLEKQEFKFYQPIEMRDDPLWIDVTKLMLEDLTPYIPRLSATPEMQIKLPEFMTRLARLRSICDINLHIEEVTGKDKTIDVVVDIFNRVNSGGTKLSKGDLALAKICAEAPDARDRMKTALARWRKDDFHFTLDWLLRNVNTVATGEAKFNALHDIDSGTFSDGLKRAEKAVDYLLDLIADRLGIDHDRVFFGRYALPVMSRYVDRRGGVLTDAKEADRLLFWYLQSAMWGRFSGSTESFLDKDLEATEDQEGALERLIQELRLWRGGLRIDPEHFSGWSLGARFYPVLYLLTRIGAARDWGTGITLKKGLKGGMSTLEVHHIFPKKRLYDHGYARADVNAVANFCFLTKNTNLKISDRFPTEYFPEIERNQPGALASQWIPMNPELWKIENYPAFLAERKRLLAQAANGFLEDLLHGDTHLMGTAAPVPAAPAGAGQEKTSPDGGITSDAEEKMLLDLNQWVVSHGLPEGQLLHEVVDPDAGTPVAIFDLAWPEGLQPGLSQPVAVLIEEGPEVRGAANAQGYRYFESREHFREYVEREILARSSDADAA